MDSFHVKSMAEDELDSFFTAEIGKPVPGEHALNTDHKIIAVRGNDLEKVLRTTTDVAMDEDRSFPIKNADVHFSGMKIDSAVIFVCFGVESHDKAPFLVNGSRKTQHTRKCMPKGGP